MAKVSVLYAGTNPFCVGRGMSHGGKMDVGLEGSSIGLRLKGGGEWGDRQSAGRMI